MYEYQAVVTYVVDGDTIDVDVDLGMHVHTRTRLRLIGINAPEVSTQEGKDVRDWLREKLTGKPVVIRTEKDRTEKYGRWLADVFCYGESVNVLLLDTGRAEPYSGGAR